MQPQRLRPILRVLRTFRDIRSVYQVLSCCTKWLRNSEFRKQSANLMENLGSVYEGGEKVVKDCPLCWDMRQPSLRKTVVILRCQEDAVYAFCTFKLAYKCSSAPILREHYAPWRFASAPICQPGHNNTRCLSNSWVAPFFGTWVSLSYEKCMLYTEKCMYALGWVQDSL